MRRKMRRSFHLGETFVKNDLHAVLELSRRQLVAPAIANLCIGVLRSFRRLQEGGEELDAHQACNLRYLRATFTCGGEGRRQIGATVPTATSGSNLLTRVISDRKA